MKLPQARSKITLTQATIPDTLQSAPVHAASHFLLFWFFAFATLMFAVFLLSLFTNLMDNQIELLTVKSEFLIAASVSLLEGGGLWLISWLVAPAARPMAMRAMIIPLFMAALIYKIAHLEDWGKFEVIFLFLLQLFVAVIAACLIAAQFTAAFAMLAAMAFAVFLLVSFARTLGS